MKKTYQTAGKRELVDFLSRHPDRQFTTEEICLSLNGDTERGKSSVYRRLSVLCAESAVRKFRDEKSGRSVYQYVGSGCDCSQHFHQKCLHCGTVSHIDCKDSESFARHMLSEHGFLVDCGQSILYGVCRACREREAQ
ncbi:MAG: transcriptional repressor [Clostridia bacterium]|nr:transcriptional repressor [Clostridia bacterium]